MKVKDIIIKHLNDNGYDGLCNGYLDCACTVEDIEPCDYMSTTDCEAGYQVPCDCGEHDYHIQEEILDG